MAGWVAYWLIESFDLANEIRVKLAGTAVCIIVNEADRLSFSLLYLCAIMKINR